MEKEKIMVSSAEINSVFEAVSEALNQRLLVSSDHPREHMLQYIVLAAMAAGSRSKFHEDQLPGMDAAVADLVSCYSPKDTPPPGHA